MFEHHPDSPALGAGMGNVFQTDHLEHGTADHSGNHYGHKIQRVTPAGTYGVLKEILPYRHEPRGRKPAQID